MSQYKMKGKNEFIIFGIVLITLVSLVMAADWTPQGNINLRETYNITGAPSINATIYYGNGSKLTDINTSEIEFNATQMEDSGGVLNILVSWLTSLFYEKSDVYNKTETYNKSEVDSNFSLYLLLTDQRFNETDLLNSVNTTVNIMSLGFYNKSEVDNNFSLYYTKTEVDNNLSLYLLITDQRYNETTLINSVNTTDNIKGLGFYSKSEVDNNLSNYILSSSEGNLNVNGSNFWDGYDTTSDISGSEYWINHTLIVYGLWNSIWSTFNLFDQSLNTTDDVVFNSVNATDWGNVSITETQVSDLIHTTDTSASVNCSTSEVLLGNGSCFGSADFYDDTTIPDSNATTACSNDEVLLGNGSCSSSDVFFDNTDTNASTECSSGEVLLGNGSCSDSDLFFDDTTIPDSNATTACSNDEVLLGNGSCSGSDAFFDDTTIPDSNATTACSTDEVLLGNGSCSSSDAFFDDTTISDTNASTECSSGEYLDGGESCYNFNDTVEQITASTIYNATNINTVDGTLDSGNITSIQVAKDGDTYNVSEDAGANAMLIIINYTGVVDFNTIILRERYSGGSGHEIAIGLYDYVDGDYEEEYGEITDMDEFAFSNIPVLDATDHISGGVASLRFRHVQNGIASHDFFLDYAVLVDGFTSLTSSSHDSLTGRDSIENHPWAMDTGATRNFTDDVNVNANLTIYQKITFAFGEMIDNLIDGLITLTGDFLVTGQVNATDWTNVTITETQVSDLIHTTDTSAEVNCSTSEIFLGNGSCLDSDDFYDDTTIPDSNATTACATDEVLLGNGSCSSSDAFFDDTTNEYTHLSNFTDDLDVNNTFNQTYENYALNVSKNYTLDVYTLWNTIWSATTTIWDAGFNESILDSNTVIWDSDFNDTGDDRWEEIFVDTSASVNCSTSEIFLGNGSCLDSDLFFDDTTIADTNASTECSSSEVLLGNESCLDSADFYDDTTTTDTSAEVNCSTSEVYLGNGSCLDSDDFYDDTTVTLWDSNFNDTGDDRWEETFVDTSASVNCSTSEVFLGNGSCMDSDLFFAAGSDTWSLNYTDYYNISNIDDMDINNTYNATYEDYAANVSINWSLDIFTLWNTVWSATTTDTSAFVNCSTSEVFLGNGSCLDSDLFFAVGFGNPFDQSLNTTDEVNFSSIYVNDHKLASVHNYSILDSGGNVMVRVDEGASIGSEIFYLAPAYSLFMSDVSMYLGYGDMNEILAGFFISDSAGNDIELRGDGMGNGTGLTIVTGGLTVNQSLKSHADSFCNATSCYSLEDFFDASTEVDPQWESNWSLGFYLNHTLDAFTNWNTLWSAQTTDTNASTECSTSEVLLGNESCLDSDDFYDNTFPGFTNVSWVNETNVFTVNQTYSNASLEDLEYTRFGSGGYIYDNGTSLILGHS